LVPSVRGGQAVFNSYFTLASCWSAPESHGLLPPKETVDKAQRQLSFGSYGSRDNLEKAIFSMEAINLSR
jgi:hypothetical protein